MGPTIESHIIPPSIQKPDLDDTTLENPLLLSTEIQIETNPSLHLSPSKLSNPITTIPKVANLSPGDDLATFSSNPTIFMPRKMYSHPTKLILKKSMDAPTIIPMLTFDFSIFVRSIQTSHPQNFFFKSNPSAICESLPSSLHLPKQNVNFIQDASSLPSNDIQPASKATKATRAFAVPTQPSRTVCI